MKFSHWYYTCKFSVVLFLTAGLSIVVGEEETLIAYVGGISILILVCLGAIGAVMGILFAMGKLKMRCPFCDAYGHVGGNKRDGLWMECPECGLVFGSGIFGLVLKREKPMQNKPIEGTK